MGTSMSDALRVKIDGTEYVLDGELTLGEQQVFKRVGGIRLAEMEDALEHGDPDALIALVIILKGRAGEPCTIEQAQQVTSLEFVTDEATGDAVPPPAPAADSPPSAVSGVALVPNPETTPNDSGARSSMTASA